MLVKSLSVAKPERKRGPTWESEWLEKGGMCGDALFMYGRILRAVGSGDLNREDPEEAGEGIRNIGECLQNEKWGKQSMRFF